MNEDIIKRIEMLENEIVHLERLRSLLGSDDSVSGIREEVAKLMAEIKLLENELKEGK
ncbi:hypothetical protein NDK43_26470 [Neobacillus pocheonensis]|uniref:Uncharacterized protein n=1 Tax=Neobacillus pocheonensis TaxID=363869 RepID=A0ABT0WID0_9BACI|nr:hypothetical protein [Neobacillus pocheonensis]